MVGSLYFIALATDIDYILYNITLELGIPVMMCILASFHKNMYFKHSALPDCLEYSCTLHMSL